ncbi:SulP family inorganic anion transporter [Erythrobacter mangrovi]|uniref:SulP family inorganic anion transporter n=1 Tax=Erythrobacter mangrovi TaxID=2739433 RepID=A0A7D4AUJ1_9SPHN|nr:SulP family inorganic anion transporter [Erythrobacter mangrovi]QKG71957.1 SulP family inorganic anion transporter [Erythrobacter mangrovi]
MKPKILTTLQSYSWQQFGADGLAGATVALVALPLSIAIAIASGAPPAAGLVTAVVAGFLISALGGSRVQIGGPTGAFIVVVYGVIHEHGYGGLLTATLMAGLILLVAGFVGAGRLIRHVPEPVIEGFTIGIAVVIAVSQLKDLAGMTGPSLPADFIPKLQGLWDMRGSTDTNALVLGIASVAAILGLRRLAPRIPWLVIVVTGASLIAALAMPSVDTVAARYGALPDGLPFPSLPSISLDQIIALLPSALTIAFLAGIESLLSAIVADRMFGGAHRSNAELIAQGAANIASPLFGGLPATGAIARTATNVNAGGRTPVAGMVHALAILLAMVVASGLAGKLALPALAGLLVVTAWTMSEPHRWGQRLHLPKADLMLLIGTALLTVLADLTIAIGVGTIVGLLLRLSRGELSAPRWHTPLGNGNASSADDAGNPD